MDRYNWKKSIEINRESNKIKRLLGPNRPKTKKNRKNRKLLHASYLIGTPIQKNNAYWDIEFFLMAYELN